MLERFQFILRGILVQGLKQWPCHTGIISLLRRYGTCVNPKLDLLDGRNILHTAYPSMGRQQDIHSHWNYITRHLMWILCKSQFSG